MRRIQFLITLLLSLAAVESEEIDLILDPNFERLNYWQSQPYQQICGYCSPIAAVHPSVPGGNYFYSNAHYSSGMEDLFATVTIPAHTSIANLDFAVQVGTGRSMELIVSLVEFDWRISSSTLQQQATGVYTNFSVQFYFAPSSDDRTEVLKFMVGWFPGEEDYISINEAHLFVDKPSPAGLSTVSKVVLIVFGCIFGSLLLVVLCGFLYQLTCKRCSRYQPLPE